MKKKTIIILISIITLGVILAIYLYLQRGNIREEKTNQLGTETVPAPKLSTTQIYKDKFPITFSIENKDLDLMTNLPVYKLPSSPLSKSSADNIAIKLGFKSQPLVADSAIGGLTYLYSQNNAGLRILPKQRVIDYKSGTLPAGTFETAPKKEVLANMAKDFLSKNELVNNVDELRLDKFSLLNINPAGEINETKKSNVASLTFIKNLNNLPLLASTYKTGMVHAMFNNNLDIILVYVDDVPELVNLGLYPLKNYDDIKNTIDQATVQSIENTQYVFGQLPENHIKSVEIDKITTAYIQEYEADSQFLQPIYILEGIAATQEGNNENIVLYMPALKSSQL
jgi:hypothetical protein